MDSHHKAEDLASLIVRSASPAEVSAAIASVRSFLLSHPADRSRPFFSLAFPALICKLFGFDVSPSQKQALPLGWIDRFQDDEVSGNLYELLSPSGLLFSSIFSADRRSLVKFVFPIERLPEWVKVVLADDRYRPLLTELCPLFGSRIKQDSGQIQLNVFEYFMFWFAYYPVCKGRTESSGTVVPRKNKLFRLERWTSSLPVLHGGSRPPGTKTELSLYSRLLYAYLRAFVPTQRLSSSSYPYRSSLLHYSATEDSCLESRAEFLLYTFMHFWLIDNDFSPVPVNIQRSLGVSFALRAALDELPPVAGVGDVALLLFEYLNSDAMLYGDALDMETKASISTDVRHGHRFDPWNLLLRRPMYRYILRTLEFCPVGSSIRNVGEVFHLWTRYLEPWKINLRRYIDLDEKDRKAEEADRLRNQGYVGFSPKSNQLRNNREDENMNQPDNTYTPGWQGYVTSNYLFYTSLVVRFLNFAHKFLHVDVETVIQMTQKVLSILLSSGELLDLLKRLHVAYISKPVPGPSSSNDNLYKFVPSIRVQLQDWEDGLPSTGDAERSSSHENSSSSLKLFSDSEDGGKQLLQLLILRAETEVQSISGEKRLRCLQALQSLKSLVIILFGPAERFRGTTPEPVSLTPVREEVFTPKHPGVGKCTWDDVKYKGDWMRRPITDDEVAWMARILVRLSAWLNEILGLDQQGIRDTAFGCLNGPERGWRYVEVSANEAQISVRDAVRMLVCWVGSRLLMVGHAAQRLMRERDLRVNLRVMASKKVVADAPLRVSSERATTARGNMLWRTSGPGQVVSSRARRLLGASDRRE
ncbi:uncharacterized protein LOC116265955 isoform X2 [Nymphaea colorata]|uniref:uncharacterized protein LOC116265955 isoform X2 n=1 Tax=Nymphaea colorata TaxID=210225 RepID=UPI00129E8FFA|nr:uncharacterized protein LOC116265955 isoform X2 [Nymphaea colorata]